MFRPSFGTGTVLLVFASFLAFMSVLGIGGLALEGTKTLIISLLVLAALSYASGLYLLWRSPK